MQPSAAALLLSFAVTAAACPRLIRALHARRVVDSQTSRSSHRGEIPRGGGLAVALGFGASLVGSWGWWAGSNGLVVEFALVLLFGLVGLADDLRGLSAGLRLGLQTVLAVLTSIAILPPAQLADGIAVILAICWVVLFVNSFNFMDGINGISAMTTVVIAISLTVSSIRWDAGIEVPCLAIAGAVVGFAPFNLTNRVFLGDVGSYLLGSALAVLALTGMERGIPAVGVLLPYTLYVTDVSYTIWRRARRGERLMQAHREHVYQRLANESGLGHIRVTIAVGAATAGLAIAAQIAGGASGATAAAALFASVLAIAVYLSAPSWLGRSVATARRVRQ